MNPHPTVLRSCVQGRDTFDFGHPPRRGSSEGAGAHAPCLARLLLVLLLARCAWQPAEAIDPPHATADMCASCHILHQSMGDDLISAAGNANLCISCHQPGGTASATSFSATDQAQSWSGLPAGSEATGSSHRWDASVAGRVTFLGGAGSLSTGTLIAEGRFTGPYSKTYTITMTVAGGVGVARFNWVASSPGGGSGNDLVTGPSVALDQGTSVTFRDGIGTSFQAGDRWNIFVHAGLNPSGNATLGAHMKDGVGDCSTCHDPHSEAMPPFDPTAPAFTGPGSGAGRDFMRVDNRASQLCTECHASHNVTSAGAGSHPVGIPVPVDAAHKSPSLLPLDGGSGNVACLTCHQVHHSPTADGKLLRTASSVSVCTDCHQQSDTGAASAHFASSNPNLLWPGGKHGSQMPARTHPADQGTCLNCHAVHGWPDASNPTTVYPKLLAESEENLCITCHGTDGPSTKLVQADFAKASRHPVLAGDQVPGRAVGCTDCHNPHLAQGGGREYSATATTARNQVSNSLKGVAGVGVNFAGLANFDAPTATHYQALASSPGATYEYEVCLKCHSGFAWGAGSPPAGQSANGTAATPVETDAAQEFNPNNLSGHPIVTGLDNYPNSIPVGGKKGLLAPAMKPPWNVNLGQQTMSCGDCHNTDAASPAAQGPHGSAARFMLRGPNANNWPNVQLRNFNSSWCANCHNNDAGDPHNEGDHQGFLCSTCHIVVPHGGKMSRLIADNDSMPSRYAFNDTLDVNNAQAFTKRAVNSYGENNCKAQCHGDGPHRNTTPTENW